MKRKRGNKKGKSKGATSVYAKQAFSNKVSSKSEENSNLDEFDNDSKYESGMEIDTPSSTGTDQPQNLANINPDGSIDKSARNSSVGRVKVKLKTSKMLESQLTSSDAPMQSDTDKSSQQTGLEKHGVAAEKMEDSANSLPEVNVGVSGSQAKKAGSIKIKSSKALGASNNQTSDILLVKNESVRYNKQELDSALTVIRKIMKMDAAEPFNAPVNPVALGIPDYFDVIDTPMDFGTICSNLESGVKYMNSEDVFKDVQYIWENCYKYNNKGDYILDLMRRVKKNFMKYWTAAGLYHGQSRATNDIESIQDNAGPSGQGKLPGKGGLSKQKSGKFHGRRHKSDCLCAICVLKRRRREREENERVARGQIGVSNNPSQDFKQEGSSLLESPGSEDSSSDMEESQDREQDAEDEAKRKEVKMEGYKPQYSTPEEKQEEEEEEEQEEQENEMGVKGGDDYNKVSDQSEDLRRDPNRQSQPTATVPLGSGVQNEAVPEDTVVQNEKEPVAVNWHKRKELQERHRKVKAYENLRIENPMLLDLCGILFPDNPRSVWRGPHSLVRDQHTSRTSRIQATVDSFMK